MSLKKQYIKSSNLCKVSFKLPVQAADAAKKVHLVGEFNNWTIGVTPMRKLKDGSFSVTLNLQPGQDYQFRYLIDGEVWENDWEADRYEFSPFGNCENSVVSV